MSLVSSIMYIALHHYVTMCNLSVLYILNNIPLSTITNLGREDFPTKWEGLLQEMVDHFKGGDFHKINGVLRTAHSLTKRYRHEFKSQELWTEIKFVLEAFAEAFTDLFKSTMQLAEQHSTNQQALQVSNNTVTNLTVRYEQFLFGLILLNSSDCSSKPTMGLAKAKDHPPFKINILWRTY